MSIGRAGKEGKDRNEPPNGTLPRDEARPGGVEPPISGSEAVDPEGVLILAGRRSFGGSILPDASVLERFCELNPDVRIYRTDHRDAEEGHTGSTAPTATTTARRLG